MTEQKSCDRLINAFARLSQDGIDCALWLVGDGGDKDKLQSLAKEKGLTNVVFLGKQLNPYKYMKNADLYVCSSLYEGYNLTVAEALILGVPTLSTNCTGPCEILDNGKYGVIVDNSEDGLFSGIKDLLTNADKLIYYRQKR